MSFLYKVEILKGEKIVYVKCFGDLISARCFINKIKMAPGFSCRFIDNSISVRNYVMK